MTAVVVGASLAGVRTAQALRSEGYLDHIVLVGDESDEPYDRPPLSKMYLAGEWEADRLRLLPTGAASRYGIELRLGIAATGLNVADREVELADGSLVKYDSVVIATGASARPSPWPGIVGVHELRTLAQSRSLGAELRNREGPVVVVGGGFIGSEVAATARKLGHDVTIVDPLPSPLGRVIGSMGGGYVADLHRQHRVDLRLGSGVEAIARREGQLQLTLTDGTRLRAVTVVVGIGAIPNDGWLAGSGLVTRDGVLCDEYCRAMGTTNVFAVGDVARWFRADRGDYTRLEHWTNAVEQASCVAYNIVHSSAPRPYRPVEYVWTDQYDWKIQIVGRTAGSSHCETVGDMARDKPRGAILFADATGLLCGAVVFNWPKALVHCRKAMPDPPRLADMSSMLTGLAG